MRDWTPEACIGELRFNGKAIDLGVPQNRRKPQVPKRWSSAPSPVASYPLGRPSGPIPICADESCQTAESLRLAHAAQANHKLVVGCMAGSLRGMAPAFVLG